MKELHDLKDKVCDQIKEYSRQELSISNLEVIGKLVDILKDVNESIRYEEGMESGMNGNGAYNGRMYNANTSRDSMGRYNANNPNMYPDWMYRNNGNPYMNQMNYDGRSPM